MIFFNQVPPLIHFSVYMYVYEYTHTQLNKNVEALKVVTEAFVSLFLDCRHQFLLEMNKISIFQAFFFFFGLFSFTIIHFLKKKLSLILLVVIVI